MNDVQTMHDVQSMNGEQNMNGESMAASSGDVSAGEVLSIAVPESAALAGGQAWSFFTRMSPDASPGWNTLTITGLPAGTRGITAWVTEWKPGDRPHAGGAWFTTSSVQLYDNGTKCRVRFHSSWGSHLPAGAQVIYG